MKLHSLLQTASAPKKDEACYLLGKLETPLRRSLDAKSETFSWLVPIVRTLMDQCYETLQLQLFLPSLPPTNGSPTFYEDFQLFCSTPEWRSFIEKHVGGTGNPVWDPLLGLRGGSRVGVPPSWDIPNPCQGDPGGAGALLSTLQTSPLFHPCRCSPPWPSLRWTRSPGATTTCPTSGTPATMP